MDHMPWLLERSAENGNRDPSGHALMASCPPQPFPKLTPDIPFGAQSANAQVAPAQQHPSLSAHAGPIANPAFSGRHGAAALPTDPSLLSSSMHTGAGQAAHTAVNVDGSAPMRTWELSKADLNTLLDLSQKLPINADGEITPIQSWGIIMSHPRLGQLDGADFRELGEVLRSKVRCYG